jgi:hypothetical protein
MKALTPEELKEISATLITCDGKGKDAKLAALHRLIDDVIKRAAETYAGTGRF